MLPAGEVVRRIKWCNRPAAGIVDCRGRFLALLFLHHLLMPHGAGRATFITRAGEAIERMPCTASGQQQDGQRQAGRHTFGGGLSRRIGRWHVASVADCRNRASGTRWWSSRVSRRMDGRRWRAPPPSLGLWQDLPVAEHLVVANAPAGIVDQGVGRTRSGLSAS